MRWITCAIASLFVAVIACGPPLVTAPTPASPTAVPPTAAPPTAVPAASPAPSPAPAPTSVAPLPGPSVSPAAVSGTEVKIVEPAFRPPQEWTYTPDEVSAKVGAQVVWTNTGAVAHTVTADDGTSFDSGSIDPKGSFTLTPTAAGIFAYHCTFHPWMKGTLVVTP